MLPQRPVCCREKYSDRVHSEIPTVRAVDLPANKRVDIGRGIEHTMADRQRMVRVEIEWGDPKVASVLLGGHRPAAHRRAQPFRPKRMDRALRVCRPPTDGGDRPEDMNSLVTLRFYQVFDFQKHVVQHGFGQAARECILLAHMVTANQPLDSLIPLAAAQ